MKKSSGSRARRGSTYDFKTQFGLNFDNEIIVDLFAGGGGASTGLEMGLGRPVDIAINHDPDAISMHEVNHPHTKHYISDVYEVDPVEACAGRPVGHFHASPDCTHHSQASGGQPRKKAVRSLSWVVHKWAGKVRPRVITLENVEQILNWSPLVAKRCRKTGRVITMDMIECPDTGKKINRVAEPGERVPVEKQYLIPNKHRKGHNWQHFVDGLRAMGYAVQWRKVTACSLGAPTTRTRLFLVARCDGQPIVWPDPTHAAKPARGQKKFRSAAECIDWTIESQSIFGRKKPLADNTLRRIAKGVKKFVLDSADPFIVPISNYGAGDVVHPIDEPLRTITAWPKGGSFAVASPVLAGVGGRAGQSEPRSGGDPLYTITSKADTAIVAPTLVSVAHGDSGGRREYPIDDPLGTVLAGGVTHAISSAKLAPFITTYYGPKSTNESARGSSMDAPIATQTTENRFGMVTAYMAQMNGGFNETPGHDLRKPTSTITNTGSQQQLVTAHLTTLRHYSTGAPVDGPLQTIAAGGQHHGVTECKAAAFMSRQFGNSIGQGLGEPAPTITAGGGGKSAMVECTLSPEHEEGALRVAAFLMHYYSEGGQWSQLDKPMSTITTRDRLALVTVHIKGTPYVIVDICLRMLQPPELYRAQGFPPGYIIDRGADGRKFTKSQQVRFVGNSVSPLPMAAIAEANHRPPAATRETRPAVSA